MLMHLPSSFVVPVVERRIECRQQWRYSQNCDSVRRFTRDTAAAGSAGCPLVRRRRARRGWAGALDPRAARPTRRARGLRIRDVSALRLGAPRRHGVHPLLERGPAGGDSAVLPGELLGGSRNRVAHPSPRPHPSPTPFHKLSDLYDRRERERIRNETENNANSKSSTHSVSASATEDAREAPGCTS